MTRLTIKTALFIIVIAIMGYEIRHQTSCERLYYYEIQSGTY